MTHHNGKCASMPSIFQTKKLLLSMAVCGVIRFFFFFFCSLGHLFTSFIVVIGVECC